MYYGDAILNTKGYGKLVKTHTLYMRRRYFLRWMSICGMIGIQHYLFNWNELYENIYWVLRY